MVDGKKEVARLKKSSTGPKTHQGKLNVSRNATKHGILSLRPVVAHFESEQGWQRHREAILESLAPEGGLEEALAERVALCSWRLNRVIAYETETITQEQEAVSEELEEDRRHKLRFATLYKREAKEILAGTMVGDMVDLVSLTKPLTGLAENMAKELVTDELWETIEPLLPPQPPKPQGGRPRIDDRAALTGIVFVLKSGIPWEMNPKEIGCGSGMTCWRRLKEWQEAGVWERLHLVLLNRLGEADQIDWERASLDSASIPAKRGGQKPQRIPRIKERRARSATLFRTEGVSHSR